MYNVHSRNIQKSDLVHPHLHTQTQTQTQAHARTHTYTHTHTQTYGRERIKPLLAYSIVTSMISYTH